MAKRGRYCYQDAMRDADRPRRRDGFLLQELDDEILLYHPQHTRAVYMNATATLIWGLCDGATPVVEIIRVLEQAFPDTVDNRRGRARHLAALRGARRARRGMSGRTLVSASPAPRSTSCGSTRAPARWWTFSSGSFRAAPRLRHASASILLRMARSTFSLLARRRRGLPPYTSRTGGAAPARRDHSPPRHGLLRRNRLPRRRRRRLRESRHSPAGTFGGRQTSTLAAWSDQRGLPAPRRRNDRRRRGPAHA